ncbi:universal stress protein [Fodinicola acaciae]|uniref:universal stress protein n=1 Tax=Fodinicola acaciae TaxID=2681555 RepID=UPI0013D55B44|nr:universal stress protein [Fodinicola acaciae]
MNDNSTRKPIVVGIDGEETGRRALAFALEEAAIRGCAVEVVYAWAYAPEGAYITRTRNEMEDAAVDLLDDEVNRAVKMRDGEPVIAKVAVEGVPSHVLCEASQRAALLVVGQHRAGPLRRAMLGSVSAACTRHAACPVVVIPAPLKQSVPDAVANPSVAPAPVL